MSPAISPVAPSPTLPLSSRHPSVSFGGFGLRKARPAAEVLPDLVESYERSLRLRETDGAAPEEKPHDDAGA